MQITCLVNNAVQHGTPCWGEHGLALLIESDAGGRVLFDTGASGDVLLHNTAALNIDLHGVDAVALSHAHYDHTGGLAALRDVLPMGTPLYGNTDLFRARFARRDNGLHPLGFKLPPEAVTAHYDVRLAAERVEIVPGVWTSGEIRERPYFEGASAYHVVQANDSLNDVSDDSGALIQDTYRDDLSLIVETADGIVLVCGCCHAGLLNTLAQVRAHFDQPIVAIVGGTHLVSASAADLDQVVQALQTDYAAPALYLNHCTGERAYTALAVAFGDRVQPFSAGGSLTL